MRTHVPFEPFRITDTGVLIAPDGSAAALPTVSAGERPRTALDGHLLGVHEVGLASDLHPELWEMHPAGDEVLAMLSGEVTIDVATDTGHASQVLQAGCGLVVPAGMWHRLLLRSPGVLLTLTPPCDTRHAPVPERQTR